MSKIIEASTVFMVIKFLFSARYKVYRFPSYLGTPIKTRTLIGAYVLGFLRSLKHGGYAEIRIVRIIDKKEISTF